MSSSPMPADSAAGVSPAPLSRPARPRRAGLATAAVPVSAVLAVAGTVAAVMLLAPRPAAIPRLPRGTVFGLRAGQCVNTAPNGVTGARAVSCGRPHMAEIYAGYRLAGAHWPGAATASRLARQGCLARLGGYLDPSLLGTSLTASFVSPGRPAWTAGERTVICEIRPVSGRLTGSVRGLGQTAG